MQTTDRDLLDFLQFQFPVESRPFAAAAARLGVSEAGVIKRVGELVDEGAIRRFGASFNSRALGYLTTLVAARVAPDEVDGVAGFINTFAEVTHNYERDDDFNIWFTVIARDEHRLNEILEEISEAPGVLDLINLPADHLFKIDVRFRMGDGK